MHKTEKILFHFSSYEHPGCRVTVQGNVIDHVEVTAARDEHIVHEAGTSSCYEEKGPTRVYGRLHGKNLPANMNKPFDIEVRSYSPVANVNCRIDIKGCWIVDYDPNNNMVEFNGALKPDTIQTFLCGPREGAQREGRCYLQKPPWNYHSIYRTLAHSP